MSVRAFDRGGAAGFDGARYGWLLQRISAHSTRVGLNQDLLASVEDLAGTMDALRWKSPRIPLTYNRNYGAEHRRRGG